MKVSALKTCEYCVSKHRSRAGYRSLLTFQNTDIGDDADHNRGNHKGNADKSDQHVADDVDDIRDGGHQSADHIGVRDYLLVLSSFSIVSL